MQPWPRGGRDTAFQRVYSAAMTCPAYIAARDGEGGAPLHVAWATDAAYWPAARLSIFAASRRTAAPAVFHVLTPPGAVAADAWRALAAALPPRHELRRIEIADARIVACAHTIGYISRTCYLRFLLPEALPGVRRCLYLDADVLALDDLATLWAECSPSAPVSAAADLNLPGLDAHMQRLGLARYFNSGVMGVNLDAWRRQDATARCFQLGASGDPRLRFQDQDVLNLVFAGQVSWLHARWNILTDFTGIYAFDAAFVDRATWEQMRAHPGIAHFTSAKKPWDLAMNHGLSWRYWEEALRSPWRAECALRGANARRRYLIRRFRYWRRWAFSLSNRDGEGKRHLLMAGKRVAVP